LFTSHNIDGVGYFSIATDARIHDDMHVAIRDGSAFAHSSTRYVLKRLRSGDRFVDVGANLGSYAIPAAMKGCHVLAIEALPQNYALLCQSVTKNGITTLTPVHAAAYDRVTTVEITGASAWGTISEAKDGIIVPALPLDDFLDIHGFGTVHLLKLDIEGAELAALQGLKRHLAEGLIGEVVIEVNEPACRAMGCTGEILLRFLHDAGFHLYMFLGDELVPRRFDEFRELYNCDFLATRSPLEKAPDGFTIQALATEISVAHVLAQARSPFEACRLYVAQSLAGAPPAIRDDLQIRAAFMCLQDDSLPAIRDACHATLAALFGQQHPTNVPANGTDPYLDSLVKLVRTRPGIAQPTSPVMRSTAAES
jgi:FkbM family methyltransferase